MDFMMLVDYILAVVHVKNASVCVTLVPTASLLSSLIELHWEHIAQLYIYNGRHDGYQVH